MLIKCLYCGNEFVFTATWKSPRCDKCGEGTMLKKLAKPTKGDVYGYRFTEKLEKKEKSSGPTIDNIPNDIGFMYDGYYNND